MVNNVQKTILFLGILIFSIVALIVAMRFLTPQPKYTFDRDRVAVVKEMKELQRLETAQFTIEKIIDAGTTESNRLKQLLFGDRILLVAHGQVIAGFDLAKMRESDVMVEGSRLIVNLPAPEILVTSVDNEKTRVYDRRQGLLTKGDENLESEARQEAEREIRLAACNSGILSQAEENGRKQFEVMFKTYQFDQVIINIPQGKCN